MALVFSAGNIFIPNLQVVDGLRGAFIFSIVHYNQDKDAYVTTFTELRTGRAFDRPEIFTEYQKTGVGRIDFIVKTDHWDQSGSMGSYRIFETLEEYLKRIKKYTISKKPT